jgi:probable HAF family extracellular repeat protein
MRNRTFIATFLLFVIPVLAHAVPYTFTTIDVPTAGRTEASGINDAGQIVGTCAGCEGGGFLFEGGTFTAIDVPGALGTEASGINDVGQIVGSFAGSEGLIHGFLFESGTFTTIDVPGAPNTIARGINNAGRIVGNVGAPQAFLFERGTFTAIDVPGALGTVAFGINDASQIVGVFGDSTGEHGFLFEGGASTAIDVAGALSTIAFDINDAGQIVGQFVDNTGSHGFLFESGTFTTIDFPGALDTRAFGINNAGQIVGRFGDDITGVHGFLATPVTSAPEPGTLSLLVAALLGAMWSCRKAIRRSPSGEVRRLTGSQADRRRTRAEVLSQWNRAACSIAGAACGAGPAGLDAPKRTISIGSVGSTPADRDCLSSAITCRSRILRCRHSAATSLLSMTMRCHTTRKRKPTQKEGKEYCHDV